MRRFCFLIFGVLFTVGVLVFGSSAESVSVRGDYVEVRTASVFAGACHFNGEVTTSGRDALMAWHVTFGSWNGVDLRGVKVLAIVTSDANLSDADAVHRSELVIDDGASYLQTVAIVQALKKEYAGPLGEVTAVLRAPIKFERDGRTYSVDAGSIASINVEAMPDDLCCKMPNLVWYSPLVPLSNRKVGYTANALYAGDKLATQWQRSGENSAFYGSFSF